jgi:hypothetical protein
VIIFSALKYQVSREAWAGLYKPLWLGAALLNSSYSYFWDVERDWEIHFFTSPGAHNATPPKGQGLRPEIDGFAYLREDVPASMLSGMRTGQL